MECQGVMSLFQQQSYMLYFIQPTNLMIRRYFFLRRSLVSSQDLEIARLPDIISLAFLKFSITSRISEDGGIKVDQQTILFISTSLTVIWRVSIPISKFGYNVYDDESQSLSQSFWNLLFGFIKGSHLTVQLGLLVVSHCLNDWMYLRTDKFYEHMNAVHFLDR